MAPYFTPPPLMLGVYSSSPVGSSLGAMYLPPFYLGSFIHPTAPIIHPMVPLIHPRPPLIHSGSSPIHLASPPIHSIDSEASYSQDATKTHTSDGRLVLYLDRDG